MNVDDGRELATVLAIQKNEEGAQAPQREGGEVQCVCLTFPPSGVTNQPSPQVDRCAHIHTVYRTEGVGRR